MIPRLWPGATVVCIACGPSLSADDVERVRLLRESGKVRVIAINAAIRMAPWADVRFAHHEADWCRPEDAEALAQFRGIRYAIEPGAARYGAEILRMSGQDGLELVDRGAVRHGQNSGYQALNVAILLGASRIVLLGYDMQRSADGRLHFYPCNGTAGRGEHARWMKHFESLREPLRALGVSVINASRETALATFPRVALAEAV